MAPLELAYAEIKFLINNSDLDKHNLVFNASIISLLDFNFVNQLALKNLRIFKNKFFFHEDEASLEKVPLPTVQWYCQEGK